jgi:hypothetical protein
VHVSDFVESQGAEEQAVIVEVVPAMSMEGEGLMMVTDVAEDSMSRSLPDCGGRKK